MSDGGLKRCRFCGVELDNPRRVKCAADACRRAHTAERVRKTAAKHKAETGQNYRNRWGRKPHARVCAVCGAEYLGEKQDSKYCSLSCVALRNRYKRLPVVDARGYLPLVVFVNDLTPRGYRRTFVGATCYSCGNGFLILGQLTSRFCSDTCQRREHRYRRRVAEKTAPWEYIDRSEVFDLCGWVCALCGEIMLRDVSVPHPLAATLDHIVPLAVGGTHTMDNVQGAHFICNAYKGDGRVSDGVVRHERTR